VDRKLGVIHRRAIVESVDSAARTFKVRWTTGAEVLRTPFWDAPYYEVLSTDPKHVRMARLQSGASPFLANHNQADVFDVFGVIQSATIAPGAGDAVVRFGTPGKDARADLLFSKIEDGIVKNVSVGYLIHGAAQMPDAADGIASFLIDDWEPIEVSAVAIGADPDATIRASNSETSTFQIRSSQGGSMDLEAQKKAEEAARKLEAERQAEEAKRALETRGQEATKIERERISGIQAACRAARLGDEFGEPMIKDGTALEEARTKVLAEMERRNAANLPSPTGNAVPSADSDAFARQFEAYVFSRHANAREVVLEAQKRGLRGFEKISLDAGDLGGRTLLQVAERTLVRAGVKDIPNDRMKLAGRAFTTRSAGMMGTTDFPVLLENVLGKILLASYLTTEDTWSRICGKDFLPDFRPSPRYRTGSFGTLDKLSETGEFKSKSLPDGSKTSLTLDTKGNKIAITRKLIVNDDMGAFVDLALKLGRAARLSIESDFYALLAANSGLGPTMDDTNPFFHSSRGNVNATGSALSAAGIDADAVVMAAQKDPSNNEYISLEPKVLLLSRGLLSQAKIINTSTTNPDGGAGKSQVPNPVAGTYTDIVGTPRVSGTRRYSFADRLVAPAFIVAFLEGDGENPVIESKDSWDVDGAELRVRFDYQVQAFDPKGAVTNAGA